MLRGSMTSARCATLRVPLCWSKPCDVLTCVLAQVNGYPSSPFDTTPLVFKKPYRKLVTLDDSIKTGKGDIPCDEVRSGKSLINSADTRTYRNFEACSAYVRRCYAA